MSAQRKLADGWSRPRRGEKLADRVAADIERRILDAEFASGDLLPKEDVLAVEMGVSRTVIRDAVRSLSARRLLDVRQGLGTVVTPPTPAGYAEAALTFLLRSDCTMGDLWDARQMLDAEMTAAAIRSPNPDWSAAQDALVAFEAAVSEARWEDGAQAHQAFHFGLMTATRNPVIELLLNPMHDIISATSDAPAPPEGGAAWRREFQLHPPILDAAMRADEAGMRLAVAHHYKYTQQGRFKAVRSDLLRESPAARAALRESRRTPSFPG